MDRVCNEWQADVYHDGDDEARSLLALLGDEYVQDILLATSEEPRSAGELSEELEVARSTVYRRAEAMLESDLLVERTRVVEDGSHHSVYLANLERLEVSLGDESLHTHLEQKASPADRFTRIWEDIRDI